MASDAEGVLRRAPCPVLIAKEPNQNADFSDFELDVTISRSSAGLRPLSERLLKPPPQFICLTL